MNHEEHGTEARRRGGADSVVIKNSKKVINDHIHPASRPRF